MTDAQKMIEYIEWFNKNIPWWEIDPEIQVAFDNEDRLPPLIKSLKRGDYLLTTEEEWKRIWKI